MTIFENVRIPNRFESVLDNDQLKPTPLIVPVDEDLRRFESLRRMARIQGGGVLSFLVGTTGVGKTTAVYSAAAFLPKVFASVLSIPHDIPLRNISEWLTDHLPILSHEKSTPVLVDGREVTDDDVGVQQLMAALNQILRRRPDLLVVWPTTDPIWLKGLQDIAHRVGGNELVSETPLEITGPPKAVWMDVLERFLIQFDRTVDELALDQGALASYADASTTVGGFLGRVSRAIASRIDEVQLAKQLPEVTFIITSTSEVVGEANRLRRATTYLLKASELVSYSPRSQAGKWWASRKSQPEHHLGYVIALFKAKLLTMTPSSVAYACLEFGDTQLSAIPRAQQMSRSPTNADRTFKNTDFYRYLANTGTAELTSTVKGKTAESTQSAYDAIQVLSSKKHKAINQAICRLADLNVMDFRGDLAMFESDRGDQNLFTDVVVQISDRELFLEFHHLSTAHCRAASMSAYIMEKLQNYAIHYNIIPR